MTTDRWQRLEQLFERATQLPTEEQEGFLQQACSDDPKLLSELLGMLKHVDTETTGDAIGNVIASAASSEANQASLEGEQLGSYKVLRKIGSGGMGDVYAAEQSDPVVRQVALKVIKRGMDTDRVLRRFQLERKTLALMDHSGIASIFDAGATQDGRPYFAMELIEDQNLSSYIQEFRPQLAERLELFAQICSAVGHAHHKGVIHRDLKPSNILVKVQDGRATVKIIDFGIAKATSEAIGEHSFYTAEGVMVGTPEYMSPEQIRSGGTDLDTRSDLYALGLILFELLTDDFPFDRQAFRKQSHSEMQRIVCEQEAPKPSQLATSSRLNSDLDWITLKALEKNPDRRYSSAAELAQDLIRYKNNEPVQATPPTTFYRFSKFAQRNRGVLLTVCSLLLSLAIGLTATLFQLQEARQSRDDSEATLDFFVNLLLRIEPREEGDREVTVRQVLDEAEQTVRQNFSKRPRIEARLRFTLGKVYLSLGLFDQAAQQLPTALKLYQAIEGETGPNTIQSMVAFSSAIGQQGNYEQAAPILKKGLELAKLQWGIDDRKTIAIQANLADLERDRGNNEVARDLFLDLVKISEKKYGKQHKITAEQLERLGVVELVLGHRDEAIKLIERAYEIQLNQLGENARATLATRHSLANAVYDTERAKKLHTENLAKLTLVLGPDHPETLLTEYDLSTEIYNLGDYAKALSMLDSIIPRLEKAKGANQRTTLAARASRALALGKQGEHERAAAEFLVIVERQRESLGPEHRDTIVSERGLLQQYLKLKKNEEALALSRHILDYNNRQHGPKHLKTLAARCDWAACLQATSKYEEALAAHLVTLQHYRENDKMGPTHSETLNIFLHIMHALRSLNRYADQIDLLQEEIATYTERYDANHPSTAELTHRLGHAYDRLGDYENARPHYKNSHSTAAAWDEFHPKIKEYGNCYANFLENQRDFKGSSEIRKQLLATARKNKTPPPMMSRILGALSRVLVPQGGEQAKLAEQLLIETQQLIIQGLGQTNWRVAKLDSLIGESLVYQQRYDAAEPYLLRAEGTLSEAEGVPSKEIQASKDKIHHLYVEWKRPDEAKKWRAPEAQSSKPE